MKKVTFIFSLLTIFSMVISGCAKKEVVKPEAKPQAKAEVSTPAQPSAPASTMTAQQTKQMTLDEVQKELKMIHFDFNKYNIRPDAKTILENNAKILRENPNVKVQIAGYCDDRGSVEYNLALGEKRAQSAKDYLVTLGIASSDLSTISYGKSDPIDPSNNEKAWAMNRRDEFHIAK